MPNQNQLSWDVQRRVENRQADTVDWWMLQYMPLATHTVCIMDTIYFNILETMKNFSHWLREAKCVDMIKKEFTHHFKKHEPIEIMIMAKRKKIAVDNEMLSVLKWLHY